MRAVAGIVRTENYPATFDQSSSSMENSPSVTRRRCPRASCFPFHTGDGRRLEDLSECPKCCSVSADYSNDAMSENLTVFRESLNGSAHASWRQLHLRIQRGCGRLGWRGGGGPLGRRRLANEAMDLGDRHFGFAHLGRIQASRHGNLAHGWHKR
jgi:hypothetical protein